MKKTICLFILAIAYFAMANLSIVSAQDVHGKNAIVCQSCQAVNPPGSKFCGECGKNLLFTPVTKFDAVLRHSGDQHKTASQTAQDSLAAKVLFDVAGHLLAQRQYDLAASYYHRIVESYPASFYIKASILMENECKQLGTQNRVLNIDKKPKKKGNGSAFGGAFLGALIAPLAILAILSAAY